MKIKFRPYNYDASLYTLRLLCTIQKKRQRLKTGVSVPSLLWLNDSQTVSLDTKRLNKCGWSIPQANEANARLDELRSKMLSLVSDEMREDEFDGARVIDAWECFRDNRAQKSIKSRKSSSQSLVGTFTACVAHKKRYPQANTRGGKGITKTTENNFNQARSSVAAFDDHYKTTTTLQNCDLDWYASYLEFLTDILCLTGETPAKHVRNVKTCLDWASEQGLKVNQDFRKKAFRAPRSFSEQKAVLSWAEIDKLREMKVTATREIARDRFLIACYTGMRAGDLQNLDKVQVRKVQGTEVLQYKQDKTEIVVSQALREPVRALRARWKGWPPPLSDQRLNDHIKELCREAGFDEKMKGYVSVQVEVLGEKVTRQKPGTVPRWKLCHIHTGRRSFCTNCYDDIGTEGREQLTVRDIMSWSGHVKEKTFFRYINREPVSDALRMAQFYS